MKFSFWMWIGCFLLASSVRAESGSLDLQAVSADSAVSEPALKTIEGMSSSERRNLVEAMIQLLRKDSESAKSAAAVLGRLGPDAKPAIADLIEALRYDDPAVTAAAGDALFKIGSASIRPLTRALGDPNFLVRERVANVLGQFGAEARPAAETLVGCLRDRQPSVRNAVEATLLKIGEPAVAPLAQALKHEDVEGRKTLAAFLARFGAPASPHLVQLVRKDESPYVRSTAAMALVTIRPPDPSVVPALVERLRDPDDGVRSVIASVLGQLGPDAQPAIAALIVVEHNDIEALARTQAAQARQAIGRATKTSLPGLIGNLRHPDLETRKDSVITISQADLALGESLPAWSVAIQDPEGAVRFEVLRAVSAQVKTDPAVVPLLKIAVADRQKANSRAAIELLGDATAAPEAAVLVLEGVLKDSDPAVRNAAVDSLARLGPPAVPVLLAEMNDSYAALGDKAENALREMGPAAFPAIEKAAPTASPEVQKKIPQLLGKGTSPKTPVPPAKRKPSPAAH